MKKGFIYFLFVALQMSFYPSDKNSKIYEWHQSHTGGGGYITGLAIDPSNPETLYARCDVGGVFKSIDGGRNWKAANNGLKKWYNHSVQSIGIHPTNSEIIFRCSGDKRNNILFGAIHKSEDGGANWKEVCNQVGFYGNGGTRMYGELIAGDPFNSQTVVVAGYSGGIWLSENTGDSWNYIAGSEERFTAVGINPFHSNQYYAGTFDGKLYFSNDKGKSWKVIFTSQDDNFGFTEFAFDRENSKIIYSASKRAGISKSTDGGVTFTKIMNGLPEGFQYNTIANTAAASGTLYTAPDARPGHNLAPVPIYKSTDKGVNWELIKNHSWDDLHNYPGYIKTLPFAGWAISKVRVNPSNVNQIFYSNWYGVGKSTDNGQTWDANQFSGLETNCLENIQVDFFDKNVYYTVADHAPLVSLDGGVSYNILPRASQFTASTALVRSRFDSSIILYGAKAKGRAGIIQVKTGEQEAKVLKEFDQGYIQALKEDYFSPGTFYAYVDGLLKQDGGIYKTIDWGLSWKKLPLTLPNQILTLPHEAAFIENELLNIVVGQKKNVCGANQLLCVDPLNKNTIYFGEWTEGIFKSSDGGNSWDEISKNLPFHKDTASVLTVIKADKKKKGWIYAGFIREGLWLSKTSGKQWEKIYPTDNSLFNVSSMHIGGMSGDEIYLTGENLFWSDAPSVVMFSENRGGNWKNIYDPKLGSLRCKSIDVDKKTGRIFLATSGNGAFYAVRKL